MTWEQVSRCDDWLLLADMVQNRVFGMHEYSVHAYLAYPLLAMGHLYRSPLRHRVEFPRAERDMAALRKRHTEVLAPLGQQGTLQVRSRQLVLEWLTPLLHLLSIHVKPAVSALTKTAMVS